MAACAQFRLITPSPAWSARPAHRDPCAGSVSSTGHGGGPGVPSRTPGEPRPVRRAGTTDGVRPAPGRTAETPSERNPMNKAELVSAIAKRADVPASTVDSVLNGLQEELVEQSPVPWTILRATQFHEFAAQIYGAITLGPLVVVPRMVSEPVAAVEVAVRLVELAEAGPSGRVADLGGPRRERMVDMVRGWARATGPGRTSAAPSCTSTSRAPGRTSRSTGRSGWTRRSCWSTTPSSGWTT